MNGFRACAILGVVACLGCAAGDRRAMPAGGPTDSVSECRDQDGDGYGHGCEDGPDCDDHDSAIHSGCLDCAQHEEGCACAADQAPEPCYLEPTEGASNDVIMCHEGTRYCRAGSWSACEDVFDYEKPVTPAVNALINADAGPIKCNACNPICFRVSDNLDPIDGGLLGSSDTRVDWATGGGLTLAQNPDGGMSGGVIDAGTVDLSGCMKGTAPDRDCDGIDDIYDPYPDMPPFATANPTIFLDIPAGQTGVGQIDLAFFLNSADVYFLVDQSASMSEERDRLKADLTMGDFINDPSYDCADYDFDFVPNNELKSQGVIGAIRCIIRDSNFGTGFFREIPFAGYANDQQVAFDNYQDITTDVMKVQAAVNRLDTVGNYEWPEASALALNNLVTGDGMYFGINKRGVPPRTDCPAGTWGYPCFRDDAIPIIIMFTDAMMHNGPSNNAYPYDPSKLTMRAGTDTEYVPVSSTNETFGSARDAQDVTNRLLTFTGETTGMSADVLASDLSCLNQEGGPDAVFQFSLSQQRDVTISSEGSRFDTVLGLFSGVPAAPTVLPNSTNANETAGPGIVQPLGEVVGSAVEISGNTAAMASDYSAGAVGCDADPASPDAVYSFTVGQDNTNVAISTEGSTIDTVVGLFDAPPETAPIYTTNGTNTNNDLTTPYELSELYGQVRSVQGDTSAAGITPVFNGADVGCGADSGSDDAVYRFDLSMPTRVEISTEGSSFDTVVALVGNTCAGGGTSAQAPVSEIRGGGNTSAASSTTHTFGTGSYIIPMDTDYQDYGMLKAYGLVYKLLLSDVPVSWVIRKNKGQNEADFTVSSTDVRSGSAVTNHGYRGGPFVVDSTDAAAAAPIVGAWLAENADGNVHVTTGPFTGYVRKQLIAAPSIAMFADRNQDIARAYMQAAGITDSDGTLAWADDGPNMLFPDQVAGASYANTHDGALFDPEGVPQFCQMMSMHWSVDQANTAEGQAVVAEYRDFLHYPVHLFAECQAVNAIENNVNGHFLTENGYRPINDPVYAEVITSWSRRHHDLPFAQMDGGFASVDGSEPHYTLPDGDSYKDDDVVMITDADSPHGHHDVWMTGYLDGSCSILNESCDPGGVQGLAQGKVSYLGGHNYKPTLPITARPSTNGTRLFLNALFEADCATDLGDAVVSTQMTGPADTMTSQVTYTVSYDNDGPGLAYAAALEYELPPGANLVSATGGAGFDGTTVMWDLGSLAINETNSFTVVVNFDSPGIYESFVVLSFKQGLTARRAVSSVVSTNYAATAGSGCSSLGLTDQTLTASNENARTAYDIGRLDGRIARLHGSTAAMTSDYDAAGMGCSAGDGVPDAAFHFRLDAPTTVAIDTEGTTFDSVIALYDAASGGTTTVASTNRETTDAAQDLGSVNGTQLTVTGGNTTGMVADYDGTSDITCAPAGGGSPDAAYRFHVDAATRVKVNTSGSSFDTVLSLHDGEIVQPAGVYSTNLANTNENRPTAHIAANSATGNILRFTGDTTSMVADQGLYSGFFEACHSYFDPNGADAVVKFDVTTAGDYDLRLQSSFNHGLAIFPAPYGNSRPVEVEHGKDGQTLPTAVKLGVLDGWGIAATGETFRDDWSVTSCNARSNARDTFFEFSLNATRTLRFDSTGSAIDSVLQVYRWTNAAHTTYTQQGCHEDVGNEACGFFCWGYNDDARLDLTLTAGDYFVVLTAEGNTEKGRYRLEISDRNPDTTTYLECRKNATDSTLTRTLAVGSYYAVIKGYQTGDAGTYTLTINDSQATVSGNNNLVACNDDAPSGGTTSEVEMDLGPNKDYWVVVKGASSGADGNYQLNISDVNVPPVGSRIACDDDGGSGSTSYYQSTLAAGDYWVILGGKSSGDKGDYDVQIRDVDASVGTVLECNDDGGPGFSSLIERNLDAGSYYVVVKGDAATDRGNYKLSVRDVTSRSYRRLACDQDSGPGQASFMQRNLDSGTYYIVVKGDGPADAGGYKLSVQDADASPVGAMACDDDGGSYQTSVINRTLNPGTYYVALKGYDASQSGRYQVTLGGAPVASQTYVPPTWATTAANLQAAGAKVIPVLSCQDDPSHGDASGDCNRTRDQAIALANATDTLGKNLQPLVFDIDRNGAGLSANVVDGIASLANYLQMDVQVVIDFDPTGNPGFIVTLEAVDDPGDGCTGVANGVEHLNCVPGATPRFLIAFENPLAAPVPLNPSDPNGGYNFKAQLIADGNFLVDQVPIYIIPEDVNPNNNPPDDTYYGNGSYWQDTASPGCSGNTRPDWRDLSWNAEVPRNTSVQFSACTSETAEGLASCVPTPIAAVRGVGSCTSDSDCTAGYCDVTVGACQVATGGACTDNAQCPFNAMCLSSVCTFTSQPIYVGSNLGAGNFQPFLRMQIDLSGTQPFPAPPVLHSWEMTYLCSTVD